MKNKTFDWIIGISLILLFIFLISNVIAYNLNNKIIDDDYSKSLSEIYGLNKSQGLIKNNFYGDVLIEDVIDAPEGELYRGMTINGGIMGIMNMKDRTNILQNWKYLECLMNPLIEDKKIIDVLMLGLGAGIIPVKIQEEYPKINLDVVEINSAVIYSADKLFGVRKTSKLNIIKNGGRIYLENTNKLYDLIIIDAYTFENTLSIPPQLITKEFFELTKNHLKEDGQMSIMLNTYNRLAISQNYQLVYNTIDNVYDNTYLFDCGFQIVIGTNKEKDYSGAKYFGNYYEIGNLDVPILTDEYSPLKLLT